MAKHSAAKGQTYLLGEIRVWRSWPGDRGKIQAHATAEFAIFGRPRNSAQNGTISKWQI
jgi:hypothetical protein